ncbi:hypothetical protein ES703_42865 [subsurface metagenome]
MVKEPPMPPVPARTIGRQFFLYLRVVLSRRFVDAGFPNLISCLWRARCHGGSMFISLLPGQKISSSTSRASSNLSQKPSIGTSSLFTISAAKSSATSSSSRVASSTILASLGDGIHLFPAASAPSVGKSYKYSVVRSSNRFSITYTSLLRLFIRYWFYSNPRPTAAIACIL